MEYYCRNISTNLDKTSYAFLAVLFIGVLITANFVLIGRGSISPNSTAYKSPLGGPALAFIKESEAAVLNTPTVDTASDTANSNTYEDAPLTENTALINSSNPVTKVQLANSGYFILPTTGWNWGVLDNHKAVDIVNSCGTPVYAAAEGLVIESAVQSSNYGYGTYVKIEHPNNTETIYAHLSKNTAPWGKYVFQGELIGYMGNSGSIDGPTSCHLHFEVIGAPNPLVK